MTLNVLDGKYEYTKKDLIGHGAFAIVFKGKQIKEDKKSVAVKVIQRSRLGKPADKLLAKEVEILKSLKHDNIVGLLDYEESKDQILLVMEFCNAGDLAEYLQKQGTLSEDTIRNFLQQIVGAMKVLNDKGIIHRDLKPQNILLNREHNERLRVKIADFGFARHLEGADMAATLCGSPMYMAPEVLMGHSYTAKADLYSIGTIVYQCLTGRAPFHATSPQELRQFYERNEILKPNIPSGTSQALRELIASLLIRNPKERLSSDQFFSHPFIKARSARRQYSTSSPTIPDAKIRTPSPYNESRDSNNVSMTESNSETVVSASEDTEGFVLIPMPRRRAVTVGGNIGDHRDYHESGFRSPDGIPLGVPDPSRYSLPPSHRSPRHSPRSAPFSRSPSDRGSPSASPPPTHNKIERAFTQPDLTSYRVGLVRTPSLQNNLRRGNLPRGNSLGQALSNFPPLIPPHLDNISHPVSNPATAVVPKNSQKFTVGTPPDLYSGLHTLPEEEINNCEVFEDSSLLEQLRFSYELGLAVLEVAQNHFGNNFRRRGERLLLFCRGLQIFASALHKARNSYEIAEHGNEADLRVILVSLNKKYKECRVECGALRALISVGDDERGEKFDSADRILYHFALKTCEEAAHADSTGDLDQSEIVQRYLTAKNLLQGICQVSDCPEDKRKLMIYQRQIAGRLSELKPAITTNT